MTAGFRPQWRGWDAIGGAAIAAICVATAGAVPGSSPRITVSDPSRDYEVRAVGVSPGGTTIQLISSSYPKGHPSDADPLLWTVVDASGNVASQDDVLARLPPSLAGSSIARGPDAGTALVVTSDGAGHLLLQTNAGELRLLRLRRGPAAPVIVPVDLGRGAVVRRMLLVADDRLLLVGWVDERPFAAVVGTDGKVLARHQIPEEGVSLVGAVLEPAGGMVVVGAKGPFPRSTTCVARLSPGGAVVATNEFPGNPADVARGSDGTMLVLIGKGLSEMSAKGLSSALVDQWTRTLVSDLPAPTPFHVAAVPSGGFVVSGTKARALWVARLKADGSELWSDTVDPSRSAEMEMTNHVELAASGDAFAVAYSAVVAPARERRGVVRAFSFKAR